MQDQTRIPNAPLTLGLAGLVPFWGLALGIGIGPVGGVSVPTLAFALAAYGAVIVSFLGGIRWGLATTAGRVDAQGLQFAVAVIPSLVAWAALALPTTLSLATLAIVALALGVVDQRLVRVGLAPVWFGRLRIILSTGAGIALLLATMLLIERG